ncbi:MAG TPA: ShlB/FhaC/HecB family hemolysin secretion/activation protein, partial [Tepidisphaeraceae bacterium]
MVKTTLLTLAALGLCVLPAAAQDISQGGPQGGAQDAPSTLPTLPALDDASGSQMLSAQDSFELRELRFTGNTAFTREQLLDASLDLGVPGGPVDANVRRVRDLVGKPVTLEELEQARVAVTLLYVNAGYINSGAVLDDQPVGDGAVVLRVIEGKLTDVNISGNKRLRGAYLKPRIERAGGPPLKLGELRDGLELLRQNPNIEQINAELRPGAELGESALDVRVTEKDTFELGVIFDNHRSPSVGAERVSAYVAHGNLLGLGDSFRAQAALTDGGFDEFDVIGGNNGGNPFGSWPELFFDYTIPITPIDTTLTLSYQKTDSTVFEEEFADLDIQSELESYGITLRQPIYRTPASEFAIFLSGNVKRNETSLLGEPFSFSPGAQNGESNSTVIRFGQEYFYRDVDQAVALRSSFTFGVDAFDSTVNPGTTADSQFWAWLGQAQYVRRLNNRGWQGVGRVAMQFTDQPLLAIEQFSVGGVDTVRGYRENTFVRDNGIAASLELRVPIYVSAARQIEVQLVPFIDAGYAYNHDDTPDFEILT